MYPRLTQLQQILEADVSATAARSLLQGALQRSKLSRTVFELDGGTRIFYEELERGLQLYCKKSVDALVCCEELRRFAGDSIEAIALVAAISLPLTCEDELQRICRICRDEAKRCGFSALDTQKILTALSELAGNILRYAGEGQICLRADATHFFVEAIDRGPGIANIGEILAGEYHSKSGLGLGILGCQRIMDLFDVQTDVGAGTHITIAKRRPRS